MFIKNSFQLQVKARKVHHIESTHDLTAHYGKKKFVLGAGTNLLFTKDIDLEVLKNDIHDISIIEEDQDRVIVRAGGGVVWHHLVMYCVKRHWWGVENLALIPGTVGAAPVQNIGAYGVELSDSLNEVHAINLENGEQLVLNNSGCMFSYRNSIFKHHSINQCFITHVDLKLTKRPNPILSYYDLKHRFSQHPPTNPEQIAAEVSAIRRSKLPDPTELGNAGSFFKNPIVPLDLYQSLRKMAIDGHQVSEKKYKVSAAKLIEHAGWKGFKNQRDAGVYYKHALVLVNHGNARGKDIADLAFAIQKDIKNKFGIELAFEVQII